MREREEIETTVYVDRFSSPDLEEWQRAVIDVLLDIRDLLSDNPKNV